MCLAIPGQIESLNNETRTATVDVMGVRRSVNVDLLRQDPPAPGDWVLIHVGFAMSKISPEQAEDQLKMLDMLGELAEAREEATGYTIDETAEVSSS